MMVLSRAALITASLALVAFMSCGGSGMGDHADHMQHVDSAMGTVPGEPAEAPNATRKIEVAALDQLRFDPASIEVAAGDVVTFVVTNEGNTEHEFVLGDAAYQEMHRGMHHGMNMPNAVTVAPGQTERLTWRFEESGEVLFGCHIDGHYDGGMVGRIEVG